MRFLGLFEAMVKQYNYKKLIRSPAGYESSHEKCAITVLLSCGQYFENSFCRAANLLLWNVRAVRLPRLERKKQRSPAHCVVLCLHHPTTTLLCPSPLFSYIKYNVFFRQWATDQEEEEVLFLQRGGRLFARSHCHSFGRQKTHQALVEACQEEYVIFC